MTETSAKKQIWGWAFFDWASQPYATLLLTFIFGPYVAELVGDGTTAQSAWGIGIAIAGIIIALLAPVLGAFADSSGSRMRWIWGFSCLYVIGAAGLWTASPEDFNLIMTLCFFALGLIGLEFTTIFTNSLLPDLGTKEEIGRISGNAWAFGYVGGLLSLIIMLALFSDSAATGLTMLANAPAFGLDGATREGTRIVGPLVAIWFVIFMVPFFLYVRDPRRGTGTGLSIAKALADLRITIGKLPRTPSLFAYLGSSMFYRDALNGLYAFGGIYAIGVLGWKPTDTGVFGILAIISGAFFAWIGGKLDAKLGPKPVIRVSILILLAVSIAIVFISREKVLGLSVGPYSRLPDIAFFIVGIVIGAAGATLGTASRTMMVRQANPDRMTEAFGLYALSGKATSFLAPLLIGAVTYWSGSQQFGVTPLIGLFLIGLILLAWVKPEGDHGP